MIPIDGDVKLARQQFLKAKCGRYAKKVWEPQLEGIEPTLPQTTKLTETTTRLSILP